MGVLSGGFLFILVCWCFSVSLCCVVVVVGGGGGGVLSLYVVHRPVMIVFLRPYRE